MRHTALILSFLLLLSVISEAQLKIGIVAGGHVSSVSENNNLPGWDTIKNKYSGRGGIHFGFVADLPFSSQSKVSFQPGVIYYNKGRKFLQHYDSATSTVIVKSSIQYINYIDIPLNIVLKLGNKSKFIIGGGPYLSLFYSGKEKTETISTGNVFGSEENNDVPVGKNPGQYKVFNYGVNGLAGFESGRFSLTVNYSTGLNDFYKATNYTGTFKHQVIGATMCIYIGKPVELEKKIKDTDKDGIADEEDNCPTEPGPALTKGCPDKDGDGVPDKTDKCPAVAGPLKNGGCPILDRDNDGVNDADDKCPDVAGVKKYNGCPVPDTDKDGVNDDDDKCPAVPGSARYNGCPIPDTDGDGINDEEDKCPAVKGTKENNGCPATEVSKEVVEKVNYAAKRIQFKIASAVLVTESYRVLDDVVKLLKENMELKLLIEGHTSTDGSLATNMKLSQDRADNVKIYLQSKGVAESRLTAKGFGPTQPLNNGKTSAEKSQNRRVELKLSN